MHIPENYLSPSTCAVMAAVMVPVWIHAVRKVKKEIPKTQMPMIGVGAAFSFLGMMFNVPMPGGTTGHAVGGTLIACLLGPNAACIAVTIALLIQALLFGDGGILSFGANCFNMAFILPYVGFAIYRLLSKRLENENPQKNNRNKVISAAIGSYAGINAAALCAAIEFGIQPALFTNAEGQALYCPYGLDVSIPAMMAGHLTIFGAAEVIFTAAIFAFILKTSKDKKNIPAIDMTASEEEAEKNNFGFNSKKARKPLIILIVVLICAVPLGLLATGTAWGEWGADEISSIVNNGTTLGFTPQGMENGFSFEALLPDYSVGNLPEVFGYILSAIIGVGILIIIFRIISTCMKNKVDFKV